MTRSSGFIVLFVLTVTFSLISASVVVTLFSIPTVQMSFAKSNKG
jgi:hypothetical protein